MIVSECAEILGNEPPIGGSCKYASHKLITMLSMGRGPRLYDRRIDWFLKHLRIVLEIKNQPFLTKFVIESENSSTDGFFDDTEVGNDLVIR